MDEGIMMIIGGNQSFEYMSRDKEIKMGVNEILGDNACGNARIRDLG